MINFYKLTCCGILLFLVTILVLFLCMFLKDMSKSRLYDSKNKELELLLNLDLNESGNILDQIINDIFSEYIILNIEIKYEIINSQLENKIWNEVCELVYKRISPLLYKKLCIIWNENELTDIIAKKVYLLCINYSIQKKTPKDNK